MTVPRQAENTHQQHHIIRPQGSGGTFFCSTYRYHRRVGGVVDEPTNQGDDVRRNRPVAAIRLLFVIVVVLIIFVLLFIFFRGRERVPFGVGGEGKGVFCQTNT